MIYLSFVELLAAGIESAGFFPANLAFFAGVLLLMFVDYLIPHQYIVERMGKGCENSDKKLVSSCFLTLVGIAIHNFPEGLAVAVASLGDQKLILPVVVAIALHNIPEGISVAMPIYFVTKDRKRSFWLSLLSGLTEPLGALVGWLFLSRWVTGSVLGLLFAFTGGVMVFISFDELLPLSFQNGRGHRAIAGILLGMWLMVLVLNFV